MNSNIFSTDRPWHTLDSELKKQFHAKVYKLSLQSGCSCPNRDGTAGTGGCTFCSAGGSGDFAAEPAPVEQQIRQAKARLADKMKKAPPAYIAYFQSYTNTYGDTDRLEEMYACAMRQPEIVGLSIATRPDCLEPEKLDMLERLKALGPVWVELGLQTVNDGTAAAFNRGYETSVYEEAYRELKARNIDVITHLILGLPGENRDDVFESVSRVSRLWREYEPAPFDGVKLQLLHVLKGTVMGESYLQEPFPVLSREDYTDLLIDCIERLPQELVIHRLTGDGPRSLLLAPMWSTDKKRVLNGIGKRMRERGTWQGRLADQS